MKKTVYTFLILTALICCLTSCPVQPIYDYWTIDQETKDYCVFKEGGYWIYQDSVMNGIDSVVLIESLHEYVDEPGVIWGRRNMVETYKNKYCHYFEDTSIILKYNLHVHFGRGGYNIENEFPIIAFNSDILYRILYIFFEGNIQYSIIEYWIEENIFYDVRVFEYYPTIARKLHKTYWAKNIGLIRYEIYNSENEIINTYNLIRYKVEQ